MGLVRVLRLSAFEHPHHQANPDVSVEQNVGIIAASIPVLSQLLTIFSDRQNPHFSHSSDELFRRGDHSNRSPLQPSVEDVGSHIQSLGSSVSTFEKRGGTKGAAESENKPSPTFSIASRLGRMSLLAEKGQGAEDSRNARTSKGSRQWEERRDRLSTLGNPAVLGYSCEIEGGSPKSGT